MEITFLFPATLFALLGLPVVAVLQMFLPRARRVTVSSLQFWTAESTDAAVEQVRRFRRLDLPALLLLVFLALTILALLGPQLSRTAATGPAGVLVVDTSASLAMTDGGSQTRFGRQRAALEQFLDRLPADLPLAVQFTPARAEPSYLEGSAGELRARLREALPSAGGALAADDLRRELLLLHHRTAAPVVVFADLTPYDQPADQPAFVYVSATGGAAANFALTDARVALRDGRPYALVKYFVAPQGPRRATLLIRGAGLALSHPLLLTPGDAAVTVELPSMLPERIDLSFTVQDDFAADNALALGRVATGRYRVGYVGRSDAALLRLLAVAGAEVYELGDAAGPLREQLDLTIFVDVLPPAGFTGPAVLVNPPETAGPLRQTGRTGGPGDWTVGDADHPLAAHLKGQPLAINSWSVSETPANGRVPWRAANGDPLVVAYESSAGPRVAILFSIARRNTAWAYQPSFVIFWADCLQYLAGRVSSETHWEPEQPAQLLLADIEGRKVSGPAVDQTAAAQQALLGHARQVRPVELELWPLLAGLALVTLVARLWLMR